MILIALFFNSCVYFNTFYNAKNSFNNAVEIIDNESSKNYQQNSTLSNTAKNLLYESISSSNIVLEKYPDSKYVDDAIYYIGRSYFNLGEIYKAEKYFNQLITEHKKSQYYNESRLWLEHSYLKLNAIDSSLSKINLIEKDFINSKDQVDDKLFFLLYDLKGDIFIQLKNYSKALFEFEKSLNFINSKTKKIMMYSKLVIISESFQEYNKAINYLEKIQILSNDKDIKIESFRKWLDIMKKLKLYDDIILGIQEKLISPEFDSSILQDELNVELAISYIKKNSFSNSKNIFNDIIENSNQKSIKAQSYYWLGYISLFYEFEIDLALEYFNLVNETMRSSKYSKDSRNYIKDIDSYKALLEEYNFLISNSGQEILEKDKEEEYFIPDNNIKNNPVLKDSLLFIIAEKLFFDFNQIDLSIAKHKEIIAKYPDSNYSLRSNKIVGRFLDDSTMNIQSLDSLSLLRDSAWNKFNNHIMSVDSFLYNTESIKEVVNMFEDIAINYNDFYSYYSLGLIYEDHLHDPYLSIKYYLQSYKLSNDDRFSNDIKNKMLLIESDLNKEIFILNKKINYLKAIDFVTVDFNLDSAIVYLKLNYEDNSLKNKVEIDSKNLDEFIINNRDSINNFKIYISNDSLVIKNINLIDSVNYKYFNYYKNKNSKSYFEKIRKNNYLLSLFKDSILYEESMDTLEIKNDNYQNKMPNINNDIAPNFNKK